MNPKPQRIGTLGLGRKSHEITRKRRCARKPCWHAGGITWHGRAAFWRTKLRGCVSLRYLFTGKGRRGAVNAGCQLLVEGVEAVAVVANHAQLVDEGLRVFLFLHLLVDEPLEHALRGVVIFREGEREDVVDEARHLLLVGQGALKHVEGRLPLRRHGIDGGQRHFTAALQHVVEEDAGVVLLLAKLYFKPVGHSRLPFLGAPGRHRKIKVCRPHFGIDLGIDSRFDF